MESPLDIALLLLRIVVGLYVAAHGARFLFGWFGGLGFNASQGFMGSMLGFRPAWLWVLGLGVAEFGGGLLTALGLLGPIGPIGISAAMLTATIVVHWAKGPWGTQGGYEQTLTNLVIAVSLAIAGAGPYSVDALLGLSVPLGLSETVAVITALGAIASVVSRQSPVAQLQPEAA
jgi:putative oxidoreductase